MSNVFWKVIVPLHSCYEYLHVLRRIRRELELSYDVRTRFILDCTRRPIHCGNSHRCHAFSNQFSSRYHRATYTTYHRSFFNAWRPSHYSSLTHSVIHSYQGYWYEYFPLVGGRRWHCRTFETEPSSIMWDTAGKRSVVYESRYYSILL